MKRFVGILCVLALAMNLMFAGTSLVVDAVAETSAAPAIHVVPVNGSIGNTVDVTVEVKDNPGIWGLKMKLSYDHKSLKLTNVKNGSIFADDAVTLPTTAEYEKEEFLYLASNAKFEDVKTSGTLVTLTFTVDKNAEAKGYPIAFTYFQAINAAGDEVSFAKSDGLVGVVKCAHVKPETYTTDDKNHWYVCSVCKEIIPDSVEAHKVVKVKAVAATCKKTGLSAGKKCSVCNAVLQEQKVVAKTAHKGVTMKAVKATKTKNGLTKGKKCKYCGKIMTKQKQIPMLSYKLRITGKTTVATKILEKKKKSAKKLCSVKKNKKLTILAVEKNWYVTYDGTVIGYTKASEVKWTGKVSTADTALTLRKTADNNGAVVDVCEKGSKVTVVDSTKNGWYKVQVKKDGKTLTGFVASKFVK